MAEGKISSKEADELANILKDSAALTALAKAGVEAGTLEDTATLESLSELSQRLLTRNRCRTAAAKFGAACVGGSSAAAPDASIETAARCLLPSYFRHDTSEGDEGTINLYASKTFVHSLPTAPEGTTLCARFSLQETSSGDDEPLHDFNLTLTQVAPFVQGAPKFSFTFAFTDTPASQAATWTLNEVQRDKLTILAKMLGLSTSRWTPAGVLGFVLAGCGCAQIDEHACFATVIRAAKEANREELLSRAGSLF